MAGGGEPEIEAGRTTSHVGSGILDAHDATIHSGHFMVSHVHDAEDSSSDTDDALPIVTSPEAKSSTQFGYDFVVAEKETSETYNFHPTASAPTASATIPNSPNPYIDHDEDGTVPKHTPTSRDLVAIDASLNRLFECMTLAYNKLTSPRWKTFKGMKVNVKDKIRLNNIIWREWHMQYIKGNEPFICQFAAPLSDDVHTKPEAVVLEGKYWKRRLDSVTSEYQKWRSFYKSRLNKARSDDHMDFEASNAILLDRLTNNDTRRIPMQRSPTPALMDEDFLMDLAADSFFASLSSQSFVFPMAKDFGSLGNADFIQPGLFPLQPNIEDFMDTMDAEMGSLMGGANFVKSEPNLATASMEFSTSPTTDKTRDPLFSPNSSLSTLDLSQIMSGSGQTSFPSQAVSTAPSLERRSSLTESRTVKTLQSLLPTSLQPATRRENFHNTAQQKSPVPTLHQLLQKPQLSDDGERVTHSLMVPASTLTHQGMTLPHVPQSSQSNRQNFAQTLSVPRQKNVQFTSVASEQAPLTGGKPAGQIQISQVPTLGLGQQIGANFQVGQTQNIQPVFSADGTMLYAVGPNPFLVQQGQKPVNIVTGFQNIPTVKLESDVILRTEPVNITNTAIRGMTPTGSVFSIPETNPTVQQLPNLPVNTTPIVATTASILVQQLMAQSSTTTTSTISTTSLKAPIASFAVPKAQIAKTTKRGHQRKPRHIAPAIATPKPPPPPPVQAPPVQPSPSSQNTYLAQLLRREFASAGTSAGATPKLSKDVESPLIVQPNEFQKKLVFAAANQAAFGTTTPFSSADFSQPSTSFSEMSDLPFSLSQSPSIPREPISTEFMDSPLGSPGESDISISDAVSLRRSSGGMDREVYREHRRVCHISAEQKRRSSIKNGFDMLHILIPSIAKSQNAKISKAIMLSKTAEYLQQLKDERVQMQREEERIRQSIAKLNEEIKDCQAQLPATGAPVTRQKEDQLKNAFDDYVRQRTMQNWKFWIFSTIFQDLFTSFNSMVSTASVEELCRTIIAWLDQHCSLPTLRPVALRSLTNLSKTTSILSDPGRVPQQAAEAVRRRDSDPTHGGMR